MAERAPLTLVSDPMCRSWMLICLSFCIGVRSATAQSALASYSLDHLEQRRKEIDGRLAHLPNYTVGGGIGAIGYRSNPHDAGDEPEWVEVRFEQKTSLDEIVVVPAIRRDALYGFQSDGFPLAMRILGGADDDPVGKTIAEYSNSSPTGIAPLTIPCGGLSAAWIRIEARSLGRRAFDGKYVLQLAEILAFRGQENVALRRPVRSSTVESGGEAPGWSPAYLTDGLLPYLMAAPDGQGTVAFVSPVGPILTPAIVIDLGRTEMLTRIHLHTVDQSDTVPQAFAGDFGIPKVLAIEGAQFADFSDAQPLIVFHHDTIYDVGPILMWNLRAFPCRYVRLKALERSTNTMYGRSLEGLGFAEVELFAGDRNVALHKHVTTNFSLPPGIRRVDNLTDGKNFYGSILPLRNWLDELAERQKLELERPEVAAEIGRRFNQQRANFTRLVWLSGLLALGVLVLLAVDRVLRRQAVAKARDRIAADLHDELGADLHALGLLTDLAHRAQGDATRLPELLRRIRGLTERAGKAARRYTSMIESPGELASVADEMHRTSARVLADLRHTLKIDDDEVLRRMSPQRSADFLLFYQECLVNIIRHSGATEAATCLTARKGRVHLTVSDNGHGCGDQVPASLARRSRLLGGRLTTGAAKPAGFRVDLDLRLRRFRPF